MTQPLIFARVQPKSIKLTEKYTYNIEVDPINDQIELGNENPQGCLEINIPYDGEKHVTIQTFEDIKRQEPLFSKQQPTSIRIGYLGFLNCEESTITDNLHINSSGVLPINIPINNQELDDEHRVGNHFSCRFIREYTPQWPNVFPVQLRIDVLDEKDITNEDEHWLDELSQWKLKQRAANDIETVLARYTQFQRMLIFYFRINLSIPYRFISTQAKDFINKDNLHSEEGYLERDRSKLKEKDEEQIYKGMPQITRLAVQWPIEVSHRSAILKANGSNKKRLYNPQENNIEWRDIDLTPPSSKSPGTDLYCYTTLVNLTITQPGELYRKDCLEGELEFKIPTALSGVGIIYFDALGRRVPEAVEYQTTLLVKFKLFLKSSFEQKKYIPSQQLEFEGVILNELRLIDIENVLSDVGFEKPVRVEVVKNMFYFIITEKGAKPEQIKLWMIIKGKITQTTRERTIPGEHTFKTVLEAGHMSLSIYGHVKGDYKSLIDNMNLIHNRLKEQFYHISSID